MTFERRYRDKDGDQWKTLAQLRHRADLLRTRREAVEIVASTRKSLSKPTDGEARNNQPGGGSIPGRFAFKPSTSGETTMNRILEVTDEDETLVLEYVSLEDLKDERILPRKKSGLDDRINNSSACSGMAIFTKPNRLNFGTKHRSRTYDNRTEQITARTVVP